MAILNATDYENFLQDCISRPLESASQLSGLFLSIDTGCLASPGGLETIKASLGFGEKSFEALDIHCSIGPCKVCHDRTRTGDEGGVF